MKKSELHRIAPILNSIHKETSFKTPKNYFQTVEENVLLKMQTHQMKFNKPANSFQVPEIYFDNFEDRVLSKLKAEALQIESVTVSTIPENYFESIEDRVITKLKNQSNTKRYSFKKSLKYIAPIAVAASLLFLIFLNLNSNSEKITFNSLATSEIENFVENGFIDFDTESIVTMYYDVEFSDSVISTISEGEALEYLDEIDIESLLNEN